MNIKIDVIGTDKCISKIHKITQLIQSDDLKEYIAKKAIAVIERDARKKLSKNDKYINHNKYEICKDFILIYNDVENDSGEHYSLIIEYGSGIYAEGGSNNSTETYAKTGGLYWYVPEEEAQGLFDYAYPRYETEEGQVFYQVFGQTPKHIYTDSAKVIQKNLQIWVNQYLKEMIGGK